MGKGSILAAVALLLASPCLAQSSGDRPSATPDAGATPPRFGRCTVSLDRSRFALGWVDLLAAINRDPLHEVSAACMTCSPVLSVLAIATDDPESEGETIEQHTTSLLADRERAGRWLADIFERRHKQDQLCPFVDMALIDGRTIAGLPFYGANAAQRCTLGQTTMTMLRMSYYEAAGEGCRFIVGVSWKGGADLSDQNRAAAERVLEGLRFSFGR